MNEQEAIEAIKGFRRLCYTDDLEGMEKSHKDKEAIDMAIKALEQQIAHRHWSLTDTDMNAYECPYCEELYIVEEGTPIDNRYNYCPNCGHKIDLSDIFIYPVADDEPFEEGDTE